jgi:UDP-N-acetylglucosamine transferase subunit ALG13
LEPSSELPVNGSEPRFLFVTVGTDHHPFDRLVKWVDAWLATPEGENVECIVQYGTSTAPVRASGHEYLEFQEIRALMGRAGAVVSHGGPGTIMLARAFGRRPIVVPREHDLGEHVDNHQLAFSRRMAAEGMILLAETEEVFRQRVASGLAEQQHAETSLTAPAAAAIARFEELLDQRLARRT